MPKQITTEGLLRIKIIVEKLFNRFGYDIIPIPSKYSSRNPSIINQASGGYFETEPPKIDPIWPLPRAPNGMSDDEIRAAFSRYALWHYAYEFDGGLSFSARHNRPTTESEIAERPLQRFKHFIPWLIHYYGGSLKDKRVLDIACNSGFWSIQCALLGAAQVIGFDARDELIEQADLVKSIVGLDNVEYRVLDFWEMNNKTLNGPFDVVLNLGILYHLPKPLEALELTKSVASDTILLDTTVSKAAGPIVRILWEEPYDIRATADAGIMTLSSKTAIEAMFRHLKFSHWRSIPLRSQNLPSGYLGGRRGSWIIKV